jgi:hypothetical protein
VDSKERKVERGNIMKKKDIKRKHIGENKKTFEIILPMLKTQIHIRNGLPSYEN